MKGISPQHITLIAVTIVSAVVTYWLQRYRLTELEECYIMIYDGQHIWHEMASPGGFAQICASMLTQLMYMPLLASLLVAIIYAAITWLLCSIGTKAGMRQWVSALASLTSICLILCLENNAYKFQGHTAMLIAIFCLWLYTRGSQQKSHSVRLTTTCLLCAAAYWLSGSCALVTVFGIIAFSLRQRHRYCYLTPLYAGVILLLGYVAYQAQLVPTFKRALTPAMYYEWDTTAFMMLYAWCSTALFILAACLWQKNEKSSVRSNVIITASILAVCSLAGARVYKLVHNPNVYRTMAQRHMARNADWQSILSLDYGNSATAFTSYRLLALAQEGRLVDELKSTNPFIGYFMKNKTLVKKEDLEVLSDIYYHCRYMGAARRYAFDTNIVTPGKFNPVETQKLAEINIATGDYKVAEKYIALLEKTLRYRSRAQQLRQYINNPKLIESDNVIADMRKNIPADNDYMSPKGTLRDLRHITRTDADAKIAKQFLEAFMILTNYKEPDEEAPMQYAEH